MPTSTTSAAVLDVLGTVAGVVRRTAADVARHCSRLRQLLRVLLGIVLRDAGIDHALGDVFQLLFARHESAEKGRTFLLVPDLARLAVARILAPPALLVVQGSDLRLENIDVAGIDMSCDELGGRVQRDDVAQVVALGRIILIE